MAKLFAAATSHAWPADGCVHLWPVPRESVERDHLIARGSPLLTAAEQARSRTYCSPSGRRRFQLGRAFMKTVLAGYLGVNPRSVEFFETPRGKPALKAAADAGLAFSLSHSGTEMILAVAHADGLGVDVERTGRGDAALRIAGAFFSNAERARLVRRGTTDGPSRDALLLWTLKEGISKALGRTVWDGLADNLLAIDDRTIICLAPLPVGESPRTWRLSVCHWGAEHVLALALYWHSQPAPSLSYRISGAGVETGHGSSTFQLLATYG